MHLLHPLYLLHPPSKKKFTPPAIVPVILDMIASVDRR
jgi:hypothetical protein